MIYEIHDNLYSRYDDVVAKEEKKNKVDQLR